MGVARLLRRQELWHIGDLEDPERQMRIGAAYQLVNRIAAPTIYCIGGLIVLMQFETFQRAGLTILASVGLMSVIVGLTARILVGNAFAEFTLSFPQPVRIGDSVELNGEYGSIEELGLLHITFRIWDNRRIVIPNSVLIAKEIVNYTLRDQRVLATAKIEIDQAADIGRAREILRDVARDCENQGGADEPEVWCMSHGGQAIKLRVVAWTSDPSRSWAFRREVIETGVRRLREDGILLPRTHLELADGNVTHSRLAPT